VKWFLYISFLLSSLASFAYQEFQPKARLVIDYQKIRIGEQIKATLQLIYSDPTHKKLVGWPRFDETLSKDIEIIDRTVDFEGILDTTGGLMRSQEFQITCFVPGFHLIPAIGIELDDSTYYTSPVSLIVEAVEIDTSKSIVDIKENYSVDYSFGEKVEDWFRSYWKWLAWIAVLIASYFVYLLWKNRRPTEEIIPYTPPIPAHITALKSLKLLEKNHAWESQEQKEYYSDLTYTVRLYLEQRFGIKAVEYTTREILVELKYADISEEDKAHLRKLLSQADMIKFAKMKADSDHGKDSLYKSIEFVEKTKKEDSKEDE
jgi:hypothetical protein